MSNELIIGIVIVGIIVLIARKWDSFKWIFALGLIGLALWTAYDMGMFDDMIGSAKDNLPSVSVE